MRSMYQGGIIYGLCAAFCLSLPARAQDADSFKHKTLTIVTSTGPGGVYDLVARLIARHMPKHLPGAPNIIVQNMPGGGNVVAPNYMHEVAPKDGSWICVVNNAVPLNQVLDGRGVRFDSAKFNWIGSTGGRNEMVFIMRSAGINSVEELTQKEAMLGGTGPGSSIVIYPTIMNHLLGTKFKIVNGYKSSTEVFLAMEKGEVVARSGSIASIRTTFPQWLRENRIVFLTQVGAARDVDYPDVPLLSDLAKTDEQKQIMALVSSPSALGQPYFVPQGVPAERVMLLRKAFADTMADKAFLAETEKAQAEILPISGEEIQKIVASVVAAPPDIVAKARAALGQR